MIDKKSKTYLKICTMLLGVFLVLYFLFIHGLTLHKNDNRLYTSFRLAETDKQELFQLIGPTSDETEIIKLCNEFSCKKLLFHRKNNLKIGEANCIGYAQYTTALLNSAFTYKNLSSTASHVVGQVHLYGINLHPLAVGVMPDNLKSFFQGSRLCGNQKRKRRYDFH